MAYDLASEEMEEGASTASLAMKTVRWPMKISGMTRWTSAK